MGGLSEGSGDERGVCSVRTAMPGTRGARNPMRYELGERRAPSPPIRLRRVRPRAIREEGIPFLSGAAPPAASFGGVSLHAGIPGYRAEESPVGGLRGYAPYVLVPDVTVTPEVEVVGNGEATTWVAVEIGAQLGRPDGAGSMAGWNGWGTMHPGLSE